MSFADTLFPEYSRNFQLGIPKLLIMCGYLPSVLGVFAPAGFASML
jgi:hypothetical protein